MTVLVTGGLGFIGSRVVLQLLKKDIDVLVTDLDIVKNKDKLESNILKIGKNKDKVKYQKLDITNYKEIENIFQNNKIDSVINLLWLTSLVQTLSCPQSKQFLNLVLQQLCLLLTPREGL